MKKLKKPKSYYIYVEEHPQGYHNYGLLIESNGTLTKKRAIELLKKEMMSKIKKYNVKIVDLGEK